MKRITAVIATHNRKDSLLASIERSIRAGFDEILVVDNASTDGTRDALAALQEPLVKTIFLTENTGGAGGFSVGVQALCDRDDSETQPDWICIFDDDAWPCSDAVDRMRRAADTLPDDIGAVGAVVERPNGSLCEMNRQGHNPFWHLGTLVRSITAGGRRGFHLTDAELARGQPGQDVDFSSFVGFFLRMSAAKDIGPPEAGLFIYGDDVLYSLALRNAGWRIWVEPSIRFVHDMKTFSTDYVYRPMWKIYYHCRNGVAIARQSAGLAVFPFALLYYITVWAKRGLHCRTGDGRQYYRLMFRGVWDGLFRKRGRLDELHD